jgi:hypothetical protein
MGNLQVTPLHRGHRREGAVLLRKRGVKGNVFCDREGGIGLMVLVGKTECRDWKTVTEVCGRQSQLCVDHRNTESQRNTARRRSGQKRNMTRGEELHAVFGLDVRLF